jgi:hypothetical protein
LGQVVGDCEPRCLRADEDVSGRADRRIIDESSHGDVDELAVADDRIEERAARLTMRVVTVLVAIDQKVVLPWVMLNLSRSMPPNGLKAEPVARRQFEQ